MALAGNHGQIIPRDRELLHRLYVVEGRSQSEIGRMFGVNHRSMGKALRDMGFGMPGQGNRRMKLFCIDCGKEPPLTLKHKLTKNGTGTRCKACLLKYKAKWVREKKKRDAIYAAKCKKALALWYVVGPSKPKGEAQWIRKAKHLLRTNRALSQEKTRLARLQFLNAEFAQEPTSQTSCRP